MSSYFADWIEDEGEEANLELAGLLITTRLAEGGGAGRDGFWNERRTQYTQLESWVRSAAVHDKLIRARDRASVEEYEAALQRLH